MSRPSRLPVVLRLARLEARDALVALAAAQREILALAGERSALTERALAAETARAPAPGSTAPAGALADAARFAASLAVHKAQLEQSFEQAVEREREARERVAGRRARVRAVERAIERRRARDARQERRREARRIDEAQRAQLQEEPRA